MIVRLGEMEHERLEARVTGDVQGVGFRVYTRDAAKSLGLSGGVRNEGDGSVYVVAEGLRDQLQSLLDKLWRGPGRVANVASEWRETTGMQGSFQVWRR